MKSEGEPVTQVISVKLVDSVVNLWYSKLALE